jgi:hypothetical protein
MVGLFLIDKPLAKKSLTPDYKKKALNPCEHIKKSSAKAPEPQLWLYFECCSQKA